MAASSSIAEPEPIAPVVRTRGRRRKSTRKTLPLDPLRVQAAEVLIEKGRGTKPLSNMERECLFERVKNLRNRRLIGEDLEMLARVSHRDIHRLKKGHLMVEDKEILKALLIAKKEMR